MKNNQRFFWIFCFISCSIDLTGQLLSVGDGPVEPSAIVALTSDSSGFLMPRLTTLEMEAIKAPDLGLIVYNTDDHQTYQYDELRWKRTGEVTYNTSLYDDRPFDWYRLEKMPVGRQRAVSFTIGNAGYLVTGTTAVPALENSMYRFTPDDNQWVQMADFPGAARVDAVAFVIGTKAYIGTGLGLIGGPLNDFYCYDSELNSWSAVAAFPGPARAAATAFTLTDHGYVGLGLVSGLEYADFYRYDPQANSWTPLNDFPEATSKAYTYSLYQDQFVAKNKIYKYNPTLDSWDEDIAQVIGSHGKAFVLNNSVYVGMLINGNVSNGIITRYHLSPYGTSQQPFVDTRYHTSIMEINQAIYIVGGLLDGQNQNQDDVFKLSLGQYKLAKNSHGDYHWSPSMFYKCVKGVSASQAGGIVDLQMGLATDQVIAVDICIDPTNNQSCIPPNYTFGNNGHEYFYWITHAGLLRIINSDANSSEILGKQITVHITYKK